MKWFYPRLLPGPVETEVTQRDQFNNDSITLSETIVREAIQNSLDASIDDPPKITVHFKTVKKPDGRFPAYLDSLLEDQWAHADAAGLDHSVVATDNPTALVIEDFGTTGLTGATHSKDEGNFSDFWRRHGKSHKVGKKRGRHGLGKLVYSFTSLTGAFFGLTVREGDPARWLMGQTVLNLRNVGGVEYQPHGFYADVKDEGDPYREIPVPSCDEELIEPFIEAFNLSRSNESGLSVVIPFPSIELDSMIAVAIHNYFYPIITGQLTIVFNDITLDATTIRNYAQEYASHKFTNIKQVFDFVESIDVFPEQNVLTLLPSWSDDGRLDENDFEVEALKEVKSAYLKGQVVGLRLPITITYKNGHQVGSFFHVYLQTPEDLDSGLDLYVRGGLTLPAESKFGDRKALGAMIAEDFEVCAFLGFAENPAHTHWIGSAQKLVQRYRNPRKAIKAIKFALVQLYDLFNEEVELTDDRALKDFFRFDEPDTGRSRENPRETPEYIAPDPDSKPPFLSINPVSGGFSVTSHADADPSDLPYSFKVAAAYDVVRGNPFKKYSSHDFRLDRTGDLNISNDCTKAKIDEKRQNSLDVKVVDLPFKLSITGFDKNRDVKVRVTRGRN